MADDPQDIGQLRDRLRALGYLDARVDRYVLGSASSGAGRARFAVAAGLRVGVVAGALLGVSAAIALAARAPGLIAGPRDAIILGLALSLFFTLISAAAVSATVIAASWYAGRSARVTPRRARAVATAAGILVAIASAAYLALWWGAAQDALTALTLGWNIVALAIAAATALLLAHAVSVVILAALARAGGGDISAGGLLSSRAFLAGFGVLLFAGAAALAAVGAGRDTSSGAEPITVRPTGYSVRVIAIDGFDAAVAERLGGDGSLPALARLLDGARVPLTAGAGGETPDPARDWTTIATGQPADRHGITSLAGRRPVGIEGRLPQARGAVTQALLNAADLLRLTTPAVATREQRRDPAFWEVAEAAGLRTAVFNWWATWPAPAGNAMVVTDRALLRLDTGGELDAEIAPAAVYDALRARWPVMRRDAAAVAASHFRGIADDALRAVVTRSAEIDLLVAAIARAAGSNGRPPFDLLVIYLPGLDIAQHQLLQASAPASVSAMSERVVALERYYGLLDDIVRGLLPPSERVVDAAILWPGRVASGAGTMRLTGGAIDNGASCDACEAGAAATILYLLGLPVADDLQSRVALEVIEDRFESAHPVRAVSGYGSVGAGRPASVGKPLDAEALERLRSLGYIR